MFNFPEELHYSTEHVWFLLEEGDVAILGVTEAFLTLVGEPEGIEFAAADEEGFSAGDLLARVITAEEELEVIAPFKGTVVELNSALTDLPETIGEDPYHDGWLIRVAIVPGERLGDFYSAGDYEDLVEQTLAEEGGEAVEREAETEFLDLDDEE